MIETGPGTPIASARRRLSPFRKRPPLVSVLRLGGVIGRTGPGRGSGLTIDSLERAIDRAFRSRRLAAVALAVNSPGGSPVQSALISRRIRQHAENRAVPILAFAEDVATSGGYWLACAADEIFADENSIVGSIGVVSAGFGFDGLIARCGIERRLYSAGPRKGMLDPFRPAAEDDVAHLRNLQSEVHEAFKSHVRARRGRRLKETEEILFSGAFWTGRRAMALGLVDGLGEMRSVLHERFGTDVRLRWIGQRPSLRRRLGIAPFLRAWPEGGATASITAEMIAALDEWAVWKRYGL